MLVFDGGGIRAWLLGFLHHASPFVRRTVSRSPVLEFGFGVRREGVASCIMIWSFGPWVWQGVSEDGFALQLTCIIFRGALLLPRQGAGSSDMRYYREVNSRSEIPSRQRHPIVNFIRFTHSSVRSFIILPWRVGQDYGVVARRVGRAAFVSRAGRGARRRRFLPQTVAEDLAWPWARRLAS